MSATDALGRELDDAIAQAAQHRARERARVRAGEHDVGSELAVAPRPCRSSACARSPRPRTATPRGRPRASSRVRICSGSASASTCWSAHTLIEATVGSGCAAERRPHCAAPAATRACDDGAHASSRRSANRLRHGSNSVVRRSRSCRSTERGAEHLMQSRRHDGVPYRALSRHTEGRQRRQVSWLAGSSGLARLPEVVPQWPTRETSPATVAGTAAVGTAFPLSPFGHRLQATLAQRGYATMPRVFGKAQARTSL